MAGLGMSIIDVKQDMAANLSQGKMNLGSNKTIGQAVAEAGTGALITEYGTAGALAAAGLAPETAGGSLLAAGVAYTISVVDSKLGISSAVGEYAKTEGNRIIKSGESLKELMNQGKQKGYGDMTDKEKKAIDKTMDNVTEQNKKIIEAKEKWVAADKAGDVKGKQEAEKSSQRKYSPVVDNMINSFVITD